MKSALHKRWWFIVGCALVGIIGFRHVWLWLPEHRYAGFIANDSFVAALKSETPNEIKRLARTYSYDYQIFRNGKLQESSSTSLPSIRLVHQPASAPGVLTTDFKEQLLSSKPYEFTRRLHRYIFFGSTAGAYTYVVYGKVL